MGSVAIVGCGYSGRRLAERWLALGAQVRGFATRAESLRQIASTGARAVSLDLDANADGSANAECAPIDCQDALVYYCVPPASHEGHDGHDDARLARFLGAMRGTPQRLLYLSTTGVYGNRGGAVVTEETAPMPTSARGARRVAAETQLRAWADSGVATSNGLPVSWCILRVSGIYGPGRLPLERLRRSDPAITAAEASPGNRIHVSDLVSVCVAAGLAPAAHRRIYNVTDGNDDSLTDYLFRVARIAGLPAPPLISRAEAQATFSESTWSFLGDSRRVDNRRMLAELDVHLAFRDLDEGIRDSMR